ncbi:MAG TPA: DUF1707 domain-containing protein [Micromonosporaceae bacterium]|jgi:hypothetical protein|nr:DUF1707 domain-containing protein [Micromonosporaceae bacterium]
MLDRRGRNGRTLCHVSVEMRASDDDRQRIIAALQRHTAAGRLSLEEFSDRVGDVYAARTLGELAGVLHDLPAERAAPAESTGDGGRHLALAFAVAILALVVLGVLLAFR